MSLLLRLVSLVVLVAIAITAFGQNATIRLRSFPNMMLADGRSTSTITAEVRDSNGRLVPDGTQIVFYTTLGAFRENVVRTIDGMAQGILVASGVPGTATITVNALSYNTTATMVYEFVGDAKMLSSAQEFIEVFAPTYLYYSLEDRILEASGPERGASLQYRTVEVEADDLQYNVSTWEVLARNARVRMGRAFEKDFSVIRYSLNQRRGLGVTSIEEEIDGEVRRRVAVVEIVGSELSPVDREIPPTTFEFFEIVDSLQHISGDKAIIFPSREIYFYKAGIHIDGARRLGMPLLQVNLDGRAPIFTEEIFQVNNNQISLSYPHYLSLKPGQTSLLRLRTGGQYGRATTSQSGIFLDYELNWYRGDEMRGGLVVGGLARNDWGLGMHHYQRYGQRTNAHVQVDLPAHRSIFGSVGVTHQFDGFTTSLNANATSTLRGALYRTQQTSLVVEKDPIKVGDLPVRLHLGVTGSVSQRDTHQGRFVQNSAGVRLRANMVPQQLSPSTSVNASASVARVIGKNTLAGLSSAATVSVGQRLGRNAHVNATYDFTDDGFNSALIGRHRLSAQGYMQAGRTSASFFASRSLDVNRLSYFGDVSYRLHPQWRLAFAYTLDQYLDLSYRDYYYLVGYRIGQREFGLTWSSRTRRLGVQFLGAYLD